MMDLSTKYMALHLCNPLIVTSCGLTDNLEGIRRCADAGAGAIVLKSLFEEQIDVESKDLEQESWLTQHPEAFDYVESPTKEEKGKEQTLCDKVCSGVTDLYDYCFYF